MKIISIKSIMFKSLNYLSDIFINKNFSMKTEVKTHLQTYKFLTLKF